MSRRDQTTRWRLRLLSQGYSVVRSKAKAPEFGWRTRVADEKTIIRWDRSQGYDTTGTRLEAGLGMIDLDIKDATGATAVARAILRAVPSLSSPDHSLLVRHGGAAKEAWPVRLTEPFGVIWSHRWMPPEHSEGDQGQRIELFGGTFPKYFALHGPHSYDAASGEVLCEYRWEALSLADVPLVRLPVLSKQDAYVAVDAADAALRDLGWTQVLGTRAGSSAGVWKHDLDETETFDCDDGVTRTFDECCILVDAGIEVRCSASFLDPGAMNRTRCRFGKTTGRTYFVIDHDSYQKHTLKLAEYDLGEVVEKLRRMKEGQNG